MHCKFLLALSLSLFSCLITMQPTVVLCQNVLSQNFRLAETWGNYCPGPRDAIRTIYTESRMRCAVECIPSLWCINFSYYATSRLCYFYSYVPQKIFYDRDCSFMMDRDARPGCPKKARLQGNCTGTNDDYYGCLTLTRVNGTSTVCLAPPVQMRSTNIDLGSGPVPLPSVNNWIVIVQRFDGSLNFNRPWIDYKNGFGVAADGEFWLGNEKVHLLTNIAGLVYRLRVEVQLYAAGRWFYADYSTFKVDSETNKYVVTVSGFGGGNAGDSFINAALASNGKLDQMKFTTLDADNDMQSYNCATKFGGGWWFKNCHLACLTCPYNTSEFRWNNLNGVESGGVLRAARMMIQSK